MKTSDKPNYLYSIIAALFICQILLGQTTKQLTTPPIHRYSFDGEGGAGAKLVDSTGAKHGEVVIESPPALPYHEGSTTMVVLPDTEGYCRKRPQVFFEMMDWVARNTEKRKINSVLHVGDITNDNLETEWKNARKAFDYIEGKVPYILATGNHDYDHTEGRLTYMNNYFKVADLKKWPSFGEVYEKDKLENHFQFLNINGQKWIVLSLEMGPRKGVIQWANKVLKEHSDKAAIILTHGYLVYNNERYDHTKGSQRATPYSFYGEGADGEMLWEQLVSRHANVLMVICGHLSSQYVGYRKDKGKHGNVVHQMLVDYEKLKGGGQGFLRLLEFLPDGKTIQVRTYSPVLNEIRSPVTKGEKPIRDPSLEEFTFKLQSAPGNERLIAASPENKKTPSPTTTKDVVKKVPAIRLNGKGQLIIDSNGSKYSRPTGMLGKDHIKGLKKVSIEVWVTPTKKEYQWSQVVKFSGSNDSFYYCFRTLTKHRAELIRKGHNEDIQKELKVIPGKVIHIVMTYDENGHNDKPLLKSYINGELTGRMDTSIKLSELNLTTGRIGPFAGIYDELRIYDYPLSPEQVRGSFRSGPDSLNIKK